MCDVSWITQQDTTWTSYTKDVIIGYDTTYEQKTVKELVSSEQKEELIFDKQQRVHSTTNDNGNKTSVFFTLPVNQITTYKTTEVISWAYWVGVGEEANEAWKQNSQVMTNAAKGMAAMFTTPLGALAVGAMADLMVPKIGEDVYYAITNANGKALFMGGQQFNLFDQGKGVAGYRKFTDPSLLQGTYFVCLGNDNYVQGVDATIKVIAIVESRTYIDKQVTEQKVTPRYEKQIYKEPNITSERKPITAQ